MSRRGEIVIECDTPTCHAEIVIDASALNGDWPLNGRLDDEGWQRRAGKDICPDCLEQLMTVAV